MKIYMLVDCTNYSLPVDISMSLKELAIKYNVPYQTMRNRCFDGKPIGYLNARVILVNVPKKYIMS